ncbi:MAG: hypothetical protein HS111_32020 [Kofleriaceae bacterium]|nr:hypothetical protein [Kofleriaceae bacterium]MCL4228665.1 hypothetical protein [Myxococcales bacterium]
MRRREFLRRSASAPLVLWAVACGGDDGPADANFQTSFQVNSETNTSGHRHNLTIMCADIGGSDVQYTSSESNEHTHRVTVTAAELSALGAGQPVTKTITDQGHSHTWILMKPSTAC